MHALAGVALFSLTIVKDCVVSVQASDVECARQGLSVWSRRCVWYALLFHKLIKAIPPGANKAVRVLVQRCMDEHGPMNCRVAWLPHTHQLFPDPFKVGAGWCWGCCD